MNKKLVDKSYNNEQYSRISSIIYKVLNLLLENVVYFIVYILDFINSKSKG